jgi:hypothetical protein
MRRVAAEQDMHRRELEKKNQYRNDLMHQIEERRRYQIEKKNHELQEKEAFQRQTKVPLQVSQY